MSTNERQRAELEKIVANLDHEDSDVRRWAIYDLGALPPELTVEHLLRGVRDEHRAVREAAAEIFLSVPAEHCLRPLTPLLGDPHIEVRNLVASVIAKFGDDAVGYLMEALKHENEDVRKFSADILGLARSDRAVNGLAKALYDPVENVGISAAEALGKIRSPKGLPHLIAAFKDRDYLKRECAEALGLLNVADGARFLMEQFFTTDDLLVQYAIVDAMGNAGDLSVLDFLETHIKDMSDSLHGPVATALLKIAKRQGVNLLGRDGTPLEILIHTAAEGDKEYQQLLIDQLDESVNPAILAKLAEAKEALSSHGLVALIKVAAPHPELHGFIQEMVNHSDDWVAYSAIEHLNHMEEEKAGQAIKEILSGERSLPQLAAIKMAHRLNLPGSRDWIEPFLESDDEDLRALATQVLGAS